MKNKLVALLFIFVICAASFLGSRPQDAHGLTSEDMSTAALQQTQVAIQRTHVASLYYDVTVSNDMLTANQSVTLPTGFTKFSYEESYSVAVPFKAAATPSMIISSSLNGAVFSAGATIASVTQTNQAQFSTTGGQKILKFALAGATPTTTAVATRVIHCEK
jgi:hypothetical protein